MLKHPKRSFGTHQTIQNVQSEFFKNLQIVELASVLAGPAVGSFFAELGASVLKIENSKTGGDMTRGWRLPSENAENGPSAYWSSVNFGKTVEFRDLENGADAAAVLEKIGEADVVISNLKPSSARRLGFDGERLRAANPRLIFAQIDAFADPEDPRPAFDIVLQAEAGFLSMTGEPGGPPVRTPVAVVDLTAAHQLKEGILVALLHRERSGEGSSVRVSLFESAVSMLINQASNWLMAGQIPQKIGLQHPNIAPYGDLFVCRDGLEIVLAVGTERQFLGLCREVAGLENLPQLVDFQSNASRVRNRVALNGHLAAAISKIDRADFLAKLNAASVPVARILNLKEVFEQPEAARLVLDEMVDGKRTRRVRSAVFEWTTDGAAG